MTIVPTTPVPAVRATTKIIVAYVAALLGIIIAWSSPIVPAANSLGDIFTFKNTIALVLLTMIWLAACGWHYVNTNDPTPIPAAMHEDTLFRLTAISGTLDGLTATLQSYETRLTTLENVSIPPTPAPVLPPTGQ